MTTLTPTIHVVDDDPSVRKALVRLLGASGLAVSAHSSAQEYLEQFDPDRPGCLVLDLVMPGLGGLELQNELAEIGTVPPIIFLSGRAEVPDSVQAMKHGAVEFLTKPVEEAMLVEAVSKALEEDCLERKKRAELAEIRKRLLTLTPREAEVLSHVVVGKANKAIAYELGTVEKTIKVHRGHIMEKMQAHSLADLVRLAVQAGIPPPA